MSSRNNVDSVEERDLSHAAFQAYLKSSRPVLAKGLRLPRALATWTSLRESGVVEQDEAPVVSAVGEEPFPGLARKRLRDAEVSIAVSPGSPTTAGTAVGAAASAAVAEPTFTYGDSRRQATMKTSFGNFVDALRFHWMVNSRPTRGSSKERAEGEGEGKEVPAAAEASKLGGRSLVASEFYPHIYLTQCCLFAKDPQSGLEMENAGLLLEDVAVPAFFHRTPPKPVATSSTGSVPLIGPNDDVSADTPWDRIAATGVSHVNLWANVAASHSALHYDNYNNILCVL